MTSIEMVQIFFRVEKRLRQHSDRQPALRAVLALAVDAEGGATTAGGLSRLLDLTSGATTRILDQLEELRWAARDEDPSDRRKVCVRLTDRGWRKAQDILDNLI